MRNLRWIFLGAFCATLGASTSSGLATTRIHVSIMGSTALVPLIKEVLPEWESKHPLVRVSVTGGGSWAGLAAVSKGQADIGMSDIAPSHLVATRLIKYPLGRLPVLFIAHRANVPRWVSSHSLRELFTGRYKNWHQAGGPNLRVVIVSRPLSSGSRYVVEQRVLLGQSLTPHAIIQLSNGALYKTVLSTPGALGYLEWRPGLKGVVVMAVGPNRFANNRPTNWPYYTEPTLYVPSQASALVKQLAFWLSQTPKREEFGIYPVDSMVQGHQ